MTPQQPPLFLLEQKDQPGKLLFRLEVPGPLPGWNELLAMEHWARYKFKKDLANAFLSALRLAAGDYLTRTTCVKNSMSIYADTLDRYLQMRLEKRKLRSAKKRLELKNQKACLSKSSDPLMELIRGKVPF